MDTMMHENLALYIFSLCAIRNMQQYYKDLLVVECDVRLARAAQKQALAWKLVNTLAIKTAVCRQVKFIQPACSPFGPLFSSHNTVSIDGDRSNAHFEVILCRTAVHVMAYTIHNVSRSLRAAQGAHKARRSSYTSSTLPFLNIVIKRNIGAKHTRV